MRRCENESELDVIPHMTSPIYSNEYSTERMRVQIGIRCNNSTFDSYSIYLNASNSEKVHSN